MSTATILSAVGVILAIVFLAYFAYKGYSPMILAPIGALIICVLSGISPDVGLLDTFSTSFGSMMKSMLFTYITGTMFAAVMTKSNAAYSIATWMANTFGYKHAPTLVLAMTAILSLGGMGMGTYFFLFPIALNLFSKSNTSKDLILGCLLGGGWALGMVPFVPSIRNTLCINTLGTTPSAGLVPGIAAGIFLFAANSFYLEM